MNKRQRNIYFLLFALSGFSGLIYESIWSHYMKLFLGHSAYAQTLVLAIFMGGMAVGSWLCSKYSIRQRNLIIAYAIVEGVIGIFALVFHTAFDQIVRFSYSAIIPHLGTPLAGNIYKWVLSALLILPQSILIGMPFPLMSAGLLRVFPENPGKSVSILYFTNTIGGAIGVLASSFILIRFVGLPGTIQTAGVLNLLLAVVVWSLAKEHTAEPFLKTPAGQIHDRYGRAGCYRLFLFASLLTGAASFIYEIGWIRMLSLVLGSSTHAFELMVSAFIFGLAFGGLWIQRHIDRVANPVLYLVIVQVIMGSLALSTLPLYGKTFEVMQWLLKTVSRTEGGYAVFNISSYSIALAVMLPTTFTAGMTLPLITYTLIRHGHGEHSIGAVYAANTIGAILGILFAVHVGMPFLGLKGLITFGACLDIALGLLLLWSMGSQYSNNRFRAVVTAACIGVVAVTAAFIKLDPYKMASGVYRHGTLLSPGNNRFLYHRDGKTATVSLSMTNSVMSIRTNGKVDAGINMDPDGEATPDEVTMILAAAIPMSLNPGAKSAANIGMGSGLTTQTLLNNPMIEHVDTVEIESCIVEAAKNFGKKVDLAYTDPRSEIHIDDAKTFFSIHSEKYDIIISEPSNPWVSGVAGLFSEEFYRLVNRHLTKDGLFVQWVQLYEIDLNLVASVLKAVSSNFSDFVVYATNDSNLLIVGRNNGNIAELDSGLLRSPEIAAALRRIHVEGIQDIAVRKIGNKQVLSRLFETFPIRANSDYYPVLDQNAARARFMKADAEELHSISHDALPTVEMLTGSDTPWRSTNVTPSPFFSKSQAAHTAMALRDYYLTGRFSPEYDDIPSNIREQAFQLRQIFREGETPSDPEKRLDSLYAFAIHMIPYLTPGELDAVWSALESGRSSHVLTKAERDWVSLFKAVGNRDARGMSKTAIDLLETSRDLHTGAVRYLLVSGMLGSLVQGDREESLRLWSEYRPAVAGKGREGLLFRLLVANSAIR